MERETKIKNLQTMSWQRKQVKKEPSTGTKTNTVTNNLHKKEEREVNSGKEYREKQPCNNNSTKETQAFRSRNNRHANNYGRNDFRKNKENNAVNKNSDHSKSNENFSGSHNRERYRTYQRDSNSNSNRSNNFHSKKYQRNQPRDNDQTPAEEVEKPQCAVEKPYYIRKFSNDERYYSQPVEENPEIKIEEKSPEATTHQKAKKEGTSENFNTELYKRLRQKAITQRDINETLDLMDRQRVSSNATAFNTQYNPSTAQPEIYSVLQNRKELTPDTAADRLLKSPVDRHVSSFNFDTSTHSMEPHFMNEPTPQYSPANVYPVRNEANMYPLRNENVSHQNASSQALSFGNSTQNLMEQPNIVLKTNVNNQFASNSDNNLLHQFQNRNLDYNTLKASGILMSETVPRFQSENIAGRAQLGKEIGRIGAAPQFIPETTGLHLRDERIPMGKVNVSSDQINVGLLRELMALPSDGDTLLPSLTAFNPRPSTNVSNNQGMSSTTNTLENLQMAQFYAGNIPISQLNAGNFLSNLVPNNSVSQIPDGTNFRNNTALQDEPNNIFLQQPSPEAMKITSKPNHQSQLGVENGMMYGSIGPSQLNSTNIPSLSRDVSLPFDFSVPPPRIMPGNSGNVNQLPKTQFTAENFSIPFHNEAVSTPQEPSQEFVPSKNFGNNLPPHIEEQLYQKFIQSMRINNLPGNTDDAANYNPHVFQQQSISASQGQPSHYNFGNSARGTSPNSGNASASQMLSNHNFGNTAQGTSPNSVNTSASQGHYNFGNPRTSPNSMRPNPRYSPGNIPAAQFNFENMVNENRVLHEFKPKSENFQPSNLNTRMPQFGYGERPVSADVRLQNRQQFFDDQMVQLEPNSITINVKDDYLNFQNEDPQNTLSF